ncbi:hypothetical protein CFAM422_006331 [Trichoderma lentiforme]|uniref:Uncharacterized protein n=1 Tax=Trichoderma lentiforme TaxID=1567552 RepID=A0A9P4XFE2_9HYPO|nr:hypothetical protein CFAM422_006331 [Trichoderma lentiforme]
MDCRGAVRNAVASLAARNSLAKQLQGIWGQKSLTGQRKQRWRLQKLCRRCMRGMTLQSSRTCVGRNINTESKSESHRMDRVAHSRTDVALITDRAAATESEQRGEE